MVVPDKVAFDAHELELDVVHLGNHARLPQFRDHPQLLGEIDGLAAGRLDVVRHVFPHFLSSFR
ncbi:hypothetical protein D3C71_2119810 [compost metagenome]